MSRFAATRGLFWDGPRNFEPRSYDGDDTRAGSPSPNFRTIPTGGHLALTDLECTRPTYMAILRWNRVSILAPSGSEVETLPPGHRGPKNCLRGKKEKIQTKEWCSTALPS
ncbi:hypothetical protein AVEN_272014-1 [Araneus ventricosus]|uniref:Uncharacterized protein n=1 Tax=Araneus ventricosus TaxID=182803 RepID=A0A4Y2J305_ARAVE|nr:hypothetical protein AVEN_272014-1 [Araneus ventricosus]